MTCIRGKTNDGNTASCSMFILQAGGTSNRCKSDRPTLCWSKLCTDTHLSLSIFVLHTHTDTHLQQHVSRLYTSICSHSSSLHDGANIDASISPLIALTHNTDAQKVVFLCEEGSDNVYSRGKWSEQRRKRWSIWMKWPAFAYYPVLWKKCFYL